MKIQKKISLIIMISSVILLTVFAFCLEGGNHRSNKIAGVLIFSFLGSVSAFGFHLLLLLSTLRIILLKRTTSDTYPNLYFTLIYFSVATFIIHMIDVHQHGLRFDNLNYVGVELFFLSILFLVLRKQRQKKRLQNLTNS